MKTISVVLGVLTGGLFLVSCGKPTPTANNSYTFNVVGDWAGEDHIVTFRAKGEEDVKITKSNQCVIVRKSDFPNLAIDFVFKGNFGQKELSCNNSSGKEEDKCAATAGNQTLTISDDSAFLNPEHSWGFKIESSDTRAQGQCLIL